jgi:hypothetical protein
MFCPNKNRTSMNFSRQVAEKSWTPRDRNEDPDISFIEKKNPLITRPFDFEKVFPIMYSMLNKNNETFRWFQYSNDILRVLVGRGVGQCHRDFESRFFFENMKTKI